MPMLRPKPMLRRIPIQILFLTALFIPFAMEGQTVNRYAVILDDPAVSAKFASRDTMRASSEARGYRQQIEARQNSLRSELQSRKIEVTGSVSTVQNAIFIAASPEKANELKSLSGVKAVIPLRRYKLKLNRATQLINAPAAWTAVGGAQNAGAGVKIAVLDSGIDQAHPSFQDSSLQMPAGYPICQGTDCAFTNNKVIVARSYVRMIATGSSPNPAADSRPDDYSPRDRIGHGTAVASAAAANVTAGGVVQFSGVAPKAYLGNYKIYGSPQVNDSTTDDIIVQALEDAYNDGMDVINFSTGGAAFTGPLDTGAACGYPVGVPCDLVAATFEQLAQQGLMIVVSAGNEGQDGLNYPTFNSIGSPANAPSVLAVGATTNSHSFRENLSVPGNGIPSNLQSISVQSGDAYIPLGAFTAPLRDVTVTGDNGLACAALPTQSLNGTIALVQRGTCEFVVKMQNIVDAGAVGVVFYMADASAPIPFGGLGSFWEPGVMISLADGQALKDFIAANPNHDVTINGTGVEVDTSSNQISSFSSRGPATGTAVLKPEVVATGTDMYMATQKFDPLGDMYSSNGFLSASGTSFSSPMTAGAAALVKQMHPSFTAAQIKSALVNTASQDVSADSSGLSVDVRSTGAGKVDAGASVTALVTAVPSTLSFGILNAANPLPRTQQIQLTNTGSTAMVLTIAVNASVPSATASVAVDQQSLSLNPGASGTVTATLSGTTPPPGAYSGVVTVQGTGVSLRIPYLFLIGSGVTTNVIPLTGTSYDGTVGETYFIALKAVDQYGVPVAGLPVTWTTSGVPYANNVTNAFGVAASTPTLGTQPGSYRFLARVAGTTVPFVGSARFIPAATQVVNGASFDTLNPIAPGSYITIFGNNLSDTTNSLKSSVIPMAIDYVNVSFDVPSAGLSYPGRMIYVSPTQVNVQVPWELQGQTSAQVKVTINYTNGNVLTVPLSNYSPAFFETGTNNAAALDLSYKPINASNPAVRGQVVQFFVNGLGPVTNQPATGDPAPLSPLATTTTVPSVSIGGQAANVEFSGLAPGFAGLYQVNARVPAGLAPGTYPITIAIGGRTSKASGIVVQ